MDERGEPKKLRFESEAQGDLTEGVASGHVGSKLSDSAQHGKRKRRLLFEDEKSEDSSFMTGAEKRSSSFVSDESKRNIRFAEEPALKQHGFQSATSYDSQSAILQPKSCLQFKDEDVPNDISSTSTTDQSTSSQLAPKPPPPNSNTPNPAPKTAQVAKQLEKSQLHIDKTEARLTKAKDKLTAQKSYKPPTAIRRFGSFIAWRYAHRKIHEKIYEVEHENAGTEAAHKTELAVEGRIRTTSRFVKHRTRSRPARRVKALSRKSAKAKANHAYNQLLHDNPDLKKKTLSRFYHKQRLKMQYATQAKQAAHGTKHGGTIIAKTVTKLKTATVTLVKSNPKVWLILLLLAMLIMILQSCVVLMTTVGSGLGGIVGGTSYLAEDTDIDDVTVLYTRWETELHYRIIHAERDNPWYDEYRFSIDDISHNPFELVAFLTAVYHDFTYAEAWNTLYEIFNEQYQLEFISEVEIRTRIETRTSLWEDDEGNTHTYTYTVVVEYEWLILNIILTSQSFSDVTLSRMDAEQTDHFHVLMLTKGNRQYLQSPFSFNWLPYVTSLYGYRISPFGGGTIERHWGLDIGLPEGTPILSGQDGRVVFAAYAGGYGFLIVIDDGEGLVSRYAHCSILYVRVGDVVSAGDMIARVGSTGQSTGAHLHLEIVKNGRHLNPLIFTVTNHHLTLPTSTALTDYITVAVPLTVAANSRPSAPIYISIPIITNHNPPITTFTAYEATQAPPMSAELFDMLIVEAESHLGTPYVFGANGPDAFDCSSFVCWVFTYSGVYHLPRTTAQGIFDRSTPIPREIMQSGDLVFFTGTFSTTRTVTHVGIYVNDGVMIHAGSPVEFTSMNTPFWERHFYSAGRLNW